MSFLLPPLLTPAPLSRYTALLSAFLSSSSFPLFVAYMIMVSQTRRWKRSTSPVEFKKFLVFYNLVVSLINVFCFSGFFYCMVKAPSLFHKEFDETLSFIFWAYWLTKVFELLDTVFMLLRHRFRQISGLHVYHHASMLLISDLGYNIYAWPAFAMPLMLNALVHIFLYFYYALTAAGYSPAWKKRLTQLQIIQFVIDLIHASIGFYYHGYCLWGISYGMSMLYLFSEFYYRAYMKENKKKE